MSTASASAPRRGCRTRSSASPHASRVDAVGASARRATTVDAPMSLPARTLAPSRGPRRPAPTETARASSARGRRIARARARDGGGDGGGGGGGARGTTEAIEEDGRDASGVFTRAATTKAHADAAARVCGDAFARETRERERGGGDEREVGLSLIHI